MITPRTTMAGLMCAQRLALSIAVLLSATLVPPIISSAMAMKPQDPQEKAGQQDTKPTPSKTEQKKAELIIKERVMVVGDPAAIRDIPGSAHFITRSQMDEKKSQIRRKINANR